MVYNDQTKWKVPPPSSSLLDLTRNPRYKPANFHTLTCFLLLAVQKKAKNSIFNAKNFPSLDLSLSLFCDSILFNCGKIRSNQAAVLLDRFGMGSEQLMAGGGPRYVQMQSEQPTPSMSSFFSFHQDAPEPTRIFDELPKATIISVSRPDAGDISPMLLSYTIECQYKQVWVFFFSFSFLSICVVSKFIMLWRFHFCCWITPRFRCSVISIGSRLVILDLCNLFCFVRLEQWWNRIWQL